VRALPSRLPSNALSALSRWNIYAGQRWWSGAGSNRRPSAFQADQMPGWVWLDNA
jgi:hypothetical protein